MKKILLTSLSFIALGVANAQLTNLNLEAWGTTDPTGWTTANAIATGSVTKITTGAPEGSFAAAVNVVSCPFCPLASLPDPFPGAMIQQVPYTARPATISFKWKGTVMTGDTSLIGMSLTLATNPVGDAQHTLLPGTNVTSWQTQSVTVNYANSNTPDTIIIGALTDQYILSGGTGTSVVGTHVDVDDFVLAGGTVGYETLETNNSLILAYPNPANSFVNLNLLGTDASQLEVVDLTGKLVYTETNILAKHIINVENFEVGSYVVRILNNKGEYIGSARFNVVR